MRIVVTIPAFNEEKSVGNVINDIKETLKKGRHSYKIIVVNDGSADKTSDAARKAGAEVIEHPINYGLAEAFRTEVQAALKEKADVIVHTDADGQYLAKDIPRLLEKIGQGYDLVLGSRFMGRIEHMPFLKRTGNIAFSKVISMILGTKISDAQTGLRAFTREVAEKATIISTHTYTQEQIIRAVREKFKVTEVPVYFARRKGKSRLIRSPFGYALRAWTNIFRILRDYEPLKFFGAIGTAFFALGFVIGIWLFYIFLTQGIVGRMPTVVLSMLLMSVGAQIVLFGFLADMIRK
ncbi:glycosyltransferase family 2 protein [Candidatus Woesearchaeota archaeon]|nr:glycosyltransferase family 2 protein [Candidatus Woesearchaeota archaeon]